MPAEVQFSWTEWHAHPSVVIGLLTFTALYLLGVGPLRKRFQGSEAAGSGEVALFLTGVLVLFVALLSPIHELGDKYLFSAHMVQHLLLTLVSPPLLLAGAPPWLTPASDQGPKDTARAALRHTSDSRLPHLQLHICPVACTRSVRRGSEGQRDTHTGAYPLHREGEFFSGGPS